MGARGIMSLGPIVRAAARSQAGGLGASGVRPRAVAAPVSVSMSARHASNWFHPGLLHPAQKNMARKMLGRGRGNGLGKTSGRGQMGQRAQTGPRNPRLGFEGGQTPLTKLFPKKGKRNALAKEYASVTLGRIQKWIDRGLIDSSKKITIPTLVQTNCISRARDGVKLIANKSENFTTPIDIEVTQATPQAISLIEVNDGTITTRYHGKVYLRSLVRPFKWLNRGRPLPTPPIPFNKKNLMYYSSIHRRGFLAKEALQGTNPKLNYSLLDKANAKLKIQQDAAAKWRETRAAAAAESKVFCE